MTTAALYVQWWKNKKWGAKWLNSDLPFILETLPICRHVGMPWNEECIILASKILEEADTCSD